jgi:uncharacterized protein YjbI with pentapeptide repeats
MFVAAYRPTPHESQKKEVPLSTFKMPYNSTHIQFKEEIGKLEDKNFTKLDLSRQSMKLREIRLLCKLLEKNDTITELDLSLNEIGVKGGEKLAKTLLQCPNITSLNIAHNIVGAESFNSFFRNPYLKKLNLMGTDLSEIYLWNQEELMEILKDNKNLKSLNLCELEFKEEIFQKMVDSVLQNTVLEEIYLFEDSSNYGAYDFTKIFLSKTLVSIHLKRAKFHYHYERDLMESMMENLSKNSTLKSLDISNATLTSDKSLDFFCQKLIEMDSLEELSGVFVFCNLNSMNSVSELIEKTRKLKYLNMDKWYFKKNFGYSELKVLFEAISNNKSITHLIMTPNFHLELKRQDIDEIISMLSKNRTIQYLETKIHCVEGHHSKYFEKKLESILIQNRQLIDVHFPMKAFAKTFDLNFSFNYFSQKRSRDEDNEEKNKKIKIL